MTMRYGSYELVGLLGRGGMGEVWRARHVLLGRETAVKLIRADMLAGDSERARLVLRRFEREVRATSGLRSPHTVEIYDFGTADDGTFFYAMELLAGLNLQTLVERHGVLPPERVVHLVLQACDSLAEAHHHGLIHRDVKPANLFACQLGLQVDFVKVLDFGLVKPAAQDESQLTADGSALGSPAFMPPELAKGQRAIDHRSDIYALGCVAYWLLTGKLVFEGESALQLALGHIQTEPVPPSRRVGIEVPAPLEDAIMACLRKEPEARPADMRELARLLRATPCAAAWTPERAEAWWREHGETALEAVQATVAMSAVERSDEPAAASPAPAAPSTSPAAPGPSPSRPTARPPSPKALTERRERAIVALQEQFVQSHIGATQLGERIAAVQGASSPEQIDAQLADLPEVPSERALAPAAPAPAPAPVATGPSSPALRRRTFFSIFGGRNVTGQWFPAQKLNAISVFGGQQFDFRKARMQPGETTLRVFSVFGGCDVVVPPGLYVIVEGAGIFGGFGESHRLDAPPPEGNQPYLRVTGMAMFGGVSVRVAAPGEAIGRMMPHGDRRRMREMRRRMRRGELPEADAPSPRQLPPPDDE
jgi:serine/threonine protein kinase